MRNVSAAELVSAWERALGRPPVDQALVLLSLASPGCSMEAMAELSVGERDGRLLTLREQLFGRHVTSVTICPRCGQRLELAFDVDDLRRPAGVRPNEAGGDLTLVKDGYRVRFRLPNSGDLASAGELGDPQAAREHLLGRCIQSVAQPGVDDDDADEARGRRLPGTVADAIVARMSEADPQSDTRLAVSCPDCRHQWVALFDIAGYLMREVHDWVVHVLREVHTLARAYGWREADILAMTPARRQAYLELAAHG
jgi:hypothetical protein